jgi:predicted nucleic acid-binding protein
LDTLPFSGLLTTWPCLTEAMHLLRKGMGWKGQYELWSFVADGVIQLHEPVHDEWIRMRELMQRYADAPMDLADASLVAAAERLNSRQIFTIDRHFYAYRSKQGRAFDVVPEPAAA